MMEFEPLREKPSDLKNWAYETIKDAILNLRFQPGEQLRVEELSEHLGTSRTPIREALQRLENEGLTRAEPRVGYFVSEISKQDLIELFELREITESYAAEKAALLMPDSEVAEIASLVKESESAVAQGNMDKYNDVEIAFHAAIMKHSGNKRLLKTIENLKDLTYRERRLALKSLENVKESIREHAAIVSALLQKDATLSGRRMKEHIHNVRERVLAFLDLGQSQDLSLAEIGHEDGEKWPPVSSPLIDS